MNFREFLQTEEMDLIAEELKLNPHILDDLEQYDEIIGSALKFAAGAGGNLVSQLGRGVGNLAAGAVQGAYGAGQAATGALQAASGGRKTGGETFKKGAGNLWSAGKRLVRGAAQTAGAATGITPVLRGAQAMSEPIGISGVYAPAGKGKNAAQDLFGLNTWKGNSKQPPPTPQTQQQAPNVQTGQRQPQTPITSTAQKQPLQAPKTRAGTQQTQARQATANPAQTGRAAAFKDLVDQYNKTRDPSIRTKIMTEFPREYQAALIRSKGARGARMAQAAREQKGRTTRTIGTAAT